MRSNGSDLDAKHVEDYVAAKAEEDNSADYEYEGWCDAPVELRNILASRLAQEEHVGDESEDDPRDDVEDVVLLREKSREPYDAGAGRGADAHTAVYSVAAQSRDERMRDME